VKPVKRKLVARTKPLMQVLRKSSATVKRKIAAKKDNKNPLNHIKAA
jgi:hypothetical protein